MRRAPVLAAVLVVLGLVLASACFGGAEPDADDRRRLDAAAEDLVFTSLPAVVTPSEVGVMATPGGGSGPGFSDVNEVSLLASSTVAPAAAARALLESARAAGWHGLAVDCDEDPHPLYLIGGRKRLADVTASLSILVSGRREPTHVDITVYTPFGDDDGGPPPTSGEPPRATCLG